MRIARALALAGICAVAAWSGTRLYQRLSTPPAHVATVSAAPPASPRPPQAGVQAGGGIPATLPAFSMADLDGHPTPVSRWQGKSLLINFWATWCAPCRREIPLLQDLHQSPAAHGVEVIGIAVDYPEAVRNFRSRYHISYPLLVGEQDALNLIASLGVETPAFPFSVFTDRRGRIVTLYLGELKRPVAEAILSAVDAVNDGRIELAAARQRIDTELQALRAER